MVTLSVGKEGTEVSALVILVTALTASEILL